MDNNKNINEWRAEEMAKIFLLKSEYKLSIEKYPTPLFDFFITLKERPEIKFAIEVKTSNNFLPNLRKQISNIITYRDSGMITIPVLLFKIDEKKETGKLDFLVIPSFIENKLLIRNNFNFEDLNQKNFNKKIDSIIKWYEK
jgi:hypothetical protein